MLIANMTMSDLLYPTFPCSLFYWQRCTLARGSLVVPLINPYASLTQNNLQERRVVE